ncbi:MAG: Rrf2 family transcriptional regulator, partial [Gammaproteobacteria bacterium]|nr:Rrf2 family transcriptional regulator [Gammaproteobacteria bacterium]
MRLASRSQYAITAMLELALSEDTDPIPLLELSHKLNISLSYMEQLFARLRQHGLVKARRGPGGGYKLSRPLREIMVSDIVCA